MSENKKQKWEVKDRQYFLKNGFSPLTYRLNTKHTPQNSLLWYDEEKGYQRELRYATNQKSPFVDEQKGNITLSHIVFEDGVLRVPKEKRNLQEFLTHHPHNGIIFAELDKVEIAKDEVEDIEFEIEALNIAIQMDVDQAEAILRVEQGSSVTEMSSKELKRDLLLYAKRNPELFLELVNDENVVLRNFGIKATEMGILKLSSDQRTFSWGSNDRKLMNVPFDEHPYSALAAWFKTDEGMEIYSNIEKRLN